MRKCRFSCWRPLVVSVCLAALSTGALPQQTRDLTRVQYRPSSQVRVVPDIVFARYGQRTLCLDLYLPINTATPVPGVIVIRGGGWMVSDRKESAHIAAGLADRGVAAASIEFRKADEAAFPGAVQDVKAAIRWMRANAKRYGVRPEAIGTLGGSSGAHMALLAGIWNDAALEGQGGHNTVSSRVQAVVAMAAPTDLLRLNPGGQSVVARFLHASPDQDPPLWRRASPVNHVSANGPAVLLLHGTADQNVLPEQSSTFAELYRQAGGRVELVLLKDAIHPFWNYTPWFEDVMSRASSFFRELNSKP